VSKEKKEKYSSVEEIQDQYLRNLIVLILKRVSGPDGQKCCRREMNWQ